MGILFLEGTETNWRLGRWVVAARYSPFGGPTCSLCFCPFLLEGLQM